MGFPLVPKSVNLNILERLNSLYFSRYSTEFDSFGSNYAKVVEDRPILFATKM